MADRSDAPCICIDHTINKLTHIKLINMWNYQTVTTANLSSVPKTILVKGDTGGFFTGEEGRDDTEALYPGSPACGRKAIDTKNTSVHDGKDFTLRHRLAKAPHKWLLLCLLAVVHICFSSQSSRSFIHIMNNAGFSFVPLGEHLATTTNVVGERYAVAHYVESLDQLYEQHMRTSLVRHMLQSIG